jgi:hypothetical protein
LFGFRKREAGHGGFLMIIRMPHDKLWGEPGEGIRVLLLGEYT